MAILKTKVKSKSSEIRVLSPPVLFVSMGTPRRERWTYEYREEISDSVCWGVGALFDYVVGIKSRVPPWMGRVGLEWFYRLIVDPAGK